MTTTADLIRKYLGKMPEKATALELHTIGGIPGQSPIASWPSGEITGDVEAGRVLVMEAAQEHCDVEGETCTLQMTWVKGSTGLASRRLRVHPSQEAADAAAKAGEASIVKELLRANLEQNKMILASMGSVVASCRDTLQAANELNRALNDRLQSIPATVVDDEGDRAIKRQAFQMLMNEGPVVLQAIAGHIAANAESKLANLAGVAGAAAHHLNGSGGTPTQ